MLAKKNRLNLAKSSNRKIFLLGKRFKTTNFVVCYKKGIKKTVQISVLISKKTLKKAVERNKYRRKIHSLLRESGFLDLKGFKIIINVRKVVGWKKKQVKEELLLIKKKITE